MTRQAEQNRLPLAATMYLRDKREPLFLADPPEITQNAEWFEGKLTSGATVKVRWDQITSIVGPKDEIEVPTDALHGKQIRIKSVYTRDVSESDLLVDLVRTWDPAEYRHLVVVYAEDMAEMEVLVMDLRREDDDLLWVNPASPESAIDRTVKAVRLLAAAETLTDEANRLTEKPEVVAFDVLTDDQRGAIASIERGEDIAHAVAITSPAFVQGYLLERAHNEIASGRKLRAVLTNGQTVAIQPDDNTDDIDTVVVGRSGRLEVMPLARIAYLVEVGSGGDEQE